MFSEKTKDLAKQLKFIEDQLRDSITADFKAAGLRGTLCTQEHMQVWFDRSHESCQVIKEHLPITCTHKTENAEHAYFNVGSVPFVTVFVKK